MQQKLLNKQDECRSKKRRVTTNVAETVELAKGLLRSTDVPGNTAPSSYVQVTAGRDKTGLAAEFDKAKAHIAELESVKPISGRQRKELLNEVKQHHAAEIRSWKKTSAEKADSLIKDVKVVKVDSVKTSVERNLILARFEKHVRALLELVTANVERKIILMDAVAKSSELLDSSCTINKSYCSVQISKLTREVQWLAGFVEPKDLKL